MGCLLSYLKSYNIFAAAAAAESIPETPKVYSWDLRKQIDPRDFTIENKNGEVVYKMPGSINGMQFIIQNLENCTVYLFDHVAQISIDDCKNCKFLIGPSKASVFIRDCSDCSLSVICQQFRTRDCKRITTFLCCATQPIIESSINMKFGCISLNYNGLNEQLKQASITPYINNWNNIHDFTPVPGETNHSFVKRENKMEDFIPLPEESIRNQLNVSFVRNDSIVPYTLGTIFRPTQESCLIVLFVSDSSEASSLKQEADARSILNTIKSQHEDLVLVQTKKFRFSETSSDCVFETNIYDNNLQKGPIVSLEFNGRNCTVICEMVVKQLRIPMQNVFVSKNTEALQSQLDNFYNFSDMQMAV